MKSSTTRSATTTRSSGVGLAPGGYTTPFVVVRVIVAQDFDPEGPNAARAVDLTKNQARILRDAIDRTLRQVHERR